jgi:hypothetical protein
MIEKRRLDRRAGVFHFCATAMRSSVGTSKN